MADFTYDSVQYHAHTPAHSRRCRLGVGWLSQATQGRVGSEVGPGSLKPEVPWVLSEGSNLGVGWLSKAT